MKRSLLLAATISTISFFPFGAVAQEMDQRLPGVWAMTNLEVADGNGSMQSIPYSGQIVFSENGHMSVQAMNNDADAADTPYTRHGYEAQYGQVATDASAGTLVFTIESALVRDLIGTQLNRRYEVTGDNLILLPADPAEGFRVTYEKK